MRPVNLSRLPNAKPSLHLAHHILQNPQILGLRDTAGSTSSFPQIIELGAGTGFLSILLSQLGADVIATDLDDADGGDKQAPLDRLRGNIELSKWSSRRRYRTNGTDDSPLPVVVEALDWADASRANDERPAIWQTLAEQSRTVLAADVVSAALS